MAKLCLRNHGFEDERASVQAAISPRARKSREPAPAAPAAGICWVAVVCDLEDLAQLYEKMRLRSVLTLAKDIKREPEDEPLPSPRAGAKVAFSVVMPEAGAGGGPGERWLIFGKH